MARIETGSTVRRVRWAVGIGVVAAIAIGATHVFVGLTPDRTAQILMEDTEFGGRALDRAIGYGAKIIAPLRKYTNDFNQMGAIRGTILIDIIEANDTEEFHELSEELFSRNGVYPKLVGAITLANRGKYPEPLNDDSFLVWVMRGWDPIGNTRVEVHAEARVIAAQAIGLIGGQDADRYFRAALENQKSLAVIRMICANLAQGGDLPPRCNE